MWKAQRQKLGEDSRKDVETRRNEPVPHCKDGWGDGTELRVCCEWRNGMGEPQMGQLRAPRMWRSDNQDELGFLMSRDQDEEGCLEGVCVHVCKRDLRISESKPTCSSPRTRKWWTSLMSESGQPAGDRERKKKKAYSQKHRVSMGWNSSQQQIVHPELIPNLKYFLSSMEHKRKYSEEMWGSHDIGPHWLSLYGQRDE